MMNIIKKWKEKRFEKEYAKLHPQIATESDDKEIDPFKLPEVETEMTKEDAVKYFMPAKKIMINLRPQDNNSKEIMKGLILGDIIGMPYEFTHDDRDAYEVPLFKDTAFFTDDTVLALATKYAVDNNISYEEAYVLFGKKYGNAGYGPSFKTWLITDNRHPYGSYGNGSAMRVHYIGSYYKNIEDVIEQAYLSAIVTHNHIEGIKGAVVTAVAVFLSKSGIDKESILDYAKSFYPNTSPRNIYSSLNEMRAEKTTMKDVSCQYSIPIAFRCFYESNSYESCIRNALSINSDTDTICAIAGGIAAAYYKTSLKNSDDMCKKYLTDKLLNVLYTDTYKMQ